MVQTGHVLVPRTSDIIDSEPGPISYRAPQMDDRIEQRPSGLPNFSRPAQTLREPFFSGSECAAFGKSKRDHALDFLSDVEQEIDPATRKSVPLSAIGRVIFLDGHGKKFGGSAVLIGDDILLTAAHNIYFHASNKPWTTSLQFYPGFDDGPGGQDLGVWSANYFYVPDAWVSDENWECDYAFVRLASKNKERAGDVTKHFFGVGNFPDIAARWSVFGYPVTGSENNEMYGVTAPGQIESEKSADFFVSSSMKEGASGGPWIPNLNPADPQSYVVFGVTSRTRADGRLYSPYFDERFAIALSDFYSKIGNAAVS